MAWIAVGILLAALIAALVYALNLRGALWRERANTELQRKLTEEKELQNRNARELLQRQIDASRADFEKSQADKLALLKEEFKTLSAKLLDERAGALQNANKEQLSAIITPLKEKLGEFKSAVEEAKNKGIELNSSLKTQLEKMLQSTSQLGADANNLAAALKGANKVQGNWGEMILDDILAGAGLRRGVHYDVQETLRGDDGRTLKSGDERMLRPDVIVHYPDGKDVIVDSKVSLSAYVDYVNAAGDGDRQEALTRHLRSVRSHVDELVRKDYAGAFRSQQREAVDFVIMFIPNEPSYQLLMEADPQLWHAAFERKVMIVSPLNLMALLQIIKIAWTRFDQERNQRLILETASQLLERLYGFYDAFDKVGRELDSASAVYRDALSRLKGGDGRHSVVLSGEKLKKLGVRMKKTHRLPERMSEPDLESEPETPESDMKPETGDE